MEKNLSLSLVLFLVLFAVLPFSAGAAEEENYLKYTSSGNVFGGGNDIKIDQDIQGDLVLVGSVLEINGNVMDDFIGAGGELIVNGDVSGNIMAFGGSIRINGNVGGDLVSAGGKIILSEDSTVEGDILLAGGEVTLNGIINGDGLVSAGALQTGENFKLKGDLELEAENYPADLKEDVGGNLNIKPTTREQKQYAGGVEGFNIFFFIIKLLASLALGFILVYIFPGFISELAEIVRDSALKAGLVGFLLLIFVPVLSIILLITFFGWSLSILLILLFALAALIATVPIKLLAGKMIYARVFKKEAGRMIYYLTGAVLFAILYEIPFLGGLIQFIALLAGLGTLGIWLSNNANPEG
ncbi:MAG: polymer-forming cytoskeletal protein [Euryarchaeota archaeon]|nr:polymer-forming cytoskeletal protein [Euryarchaeota archaeon]